MYKHLKERFDYIPSIEKLERGARPAVVTVRTTQLGGPSETKQTVFETQYAVDYEKEELIFHFATQDLGLLKVRLLPKSIPATHKVAAGEVYRAIFKKKRSTIRMYPHKPIDSGVKLYVGHYRGQYETEQVEFASKEDAELRAKLTGLKLVALEEMNPRKTRDTYYREPDGRVDRSVTPTAVMFFAEENSQDVLYSVGFLLDLIAKAESAKEQLKELGLSRSDMERAWDFMYRGEVPMPDV